MSPGAGAKPYESTDQSLDRQAGWAAASIIKKKQRYDQSTDPNKGDFVTYFGKQWAPVGVSNDPTNLNKNWIGNVKKFQQSYLNCEGGNCTVQQTKTEQTPTTPPSNPPSNPNSPAIPPLKY